MKKKPVARMRLNERRRRESYLWYGASMLTLVLVIGTIAYVSRLPELRIREVRIEGAVHAKAAELETLTKDTIGSSYAFLVPKDLRYLVPKGAIVERVTSVPQVESARVSQNGGTLTVHVTERAPAARYCATACFRMDAYGFIFDTVHSDHDTIYRGGQLDVGGTYLGGRFHDLYNTVRELENTVGARATEVLVDNASDVFVRFEGQGEVRFTLDTPGQKLDADVKAVMTSAQMADSPTFEYIDLRFGTKAVVMPVHAKK
jgi:cell division septal protein FtsQ